MESDNQEGKVFSWTDDKANQERVLSNFLSQIVNNHRESIERVLIRSTSGGTL